MVDDENALKLCPGNNPMNRLKPAEVDKFKGTILWYVTSIS